MKYKCLDCDEILIITHYWGVSDYLECPVCELCVKIVGDDE